jgi:hypothetical protein
MIKVCYNNGTIGQYLSIREARKEILDTITGCDFAVSVDSIKEGENELVLKWSLDLFYKCSNPQY